MRILVEMKMHKLRFINKDCNFEVLGATRAPTMLRVEHKIRTIEDLCKIGYDHIQEILPEDAEMINRYVKSLADASYYMLLLDCDILPCWQPLNDGNGNPLYWNMKTAFGYGSQAMLQAALRCDTEDKIITQELVEKVPYLLQLVWSDILRCAGRMWQDGKLLSVTECVQLRASVAEERVVIEAIQELKRLKYIKMKGDRIKLCLPTLDDFLSTDDMMKSSHKTKGWKAMELLLQGKKRTEIAEEWGTTRQVVSVAIQRELTKRPLLEEDGYRSLYETYHLNKEVFCSATKQPERTWNYLVAVYRRGKRKYTLIQDDASDALPAIQFRNYLMKNHTRKTLVLPDGVYPRSAFAIQDYVLRNYTPESITLSEFVERYNWFLNGLKVKEPEKLMMRAVHCNDRLRKSKRTLWTYPNKFRYYDMEMRDFRKLYQQITKFMQNDTHFCGDTVSIFENNRDLMQEYDIRDPFELHNLIRKTRNEYLGFPGVEQIVVQHMPSIGYRRYEEHSAAAVRLD